MISREELKQQLLKALNIKVENNRYVCSKSSIVKYKAKKNKNLIEQLVQYTSFLPNIIRPAERLYYFFYNKNKYQEKYYCKTCGKEIESQININGERTKNYCSRHCQATDPISLQKRQETWDKKHYPGYDPRRTKEANENRKQTNNKLYGGDFPFCSSEIQQKIVNNLFESEGIINISQREDVKQQKAEKVEQRTTEESKLIYETMWETYKKRTGYTHPNHNPDSIKKRKNTLFKKTGYSTLTENPNINFGKGLAVNRKKYLNTDLYYDSKNELNFIELWLEFYPIKTIKRAKSFKYLYKGKTCYYHPDFELTYPDGKKEIVEVKATHQYFYNDLWSGKLMAKWDSIPKEYSYCFILNGEITTKVDIIKNIVIPYMIKNPLFFSTTSY